MEGNRSLFCPLISDRRFLSLPPISYFGNCRLPGKKEKREFQISLKTIDFLPSLLPFNIFPCPAKREGRLKTKYIFNQRKKTLPFHFSLPVRRSAFPRQVCFFFILIQNKWSLFPIFKFPVLIFVFFQCNFFLRVPSISRYWTPSCELGKKSSLGEHKKTVSQFWKKAFLVKIGKIG